MPEPAGLPGALLGAARGAGGEMKEGSWQHWSIKSVRPRLETLSVWPSKILVRIPQRALPKGQTRSVPQEEMSACSGIPGPGRAEPSLHLMSTFNPPAGSLFATEGGLGCKIINWDQLFKNKEAPANGTSWATGGSRHSTRQCFYLCKVNHLILLRYSPSPGWKTLREALPRTGRLTSGRSWRGTSYSREHCRRQPSWCLPSLRRWPEPPERRRQQVWAEWSNASEFPSDRHHHQACTWRGKRYNIQYTIYNIRPTFDHRVVLQAAQKQWHRWKWDKAPSGPKLPWSQCLEEPKSTRVRRGEVWQKVDKDKNLLD